jgi:PiT family inorganic phosphate transporter
VEISFVLIFLIVVALAFDMLNGLHDAANSIATIVSTRVLPAKYAVIWAAFFNFIAFLVVPQAVAKTIGSGLVAPHFVSDQLIFAALFGAISWNLLTWRLGIPSSSSHALLGGMVGAGIAAGGMNAIIWKGTTKTVMAIVLSPTIGFILALVLVLIVAWAFVKATPALGDKVFRRMQFVSAALFSISHGGNDAQKTMGIITALLVAHGYNHGEFHIPFWVIITCQAAMGLGTLFGGWRIVHTMGSKITKLTPMQGFCAETGAAITVLAATHFGIPVSTTQTISGAIVGVGASKRVSAVRWNVAKDIVIAWVLTLPAAGVVGALAYWAWGLFT